MLFSKYFLNTLLLHPIELLLQENTYDGLIGISQPCKFIANMGLHNSVVNLFKQLNVLFVLGYVRIR